MRWIETFSDGATRRAGRLIGLAVDGVTGESGPVYAEGAVSRVEALVAFPDLAPWWDIACKGDCPAKVWSWFRKHIEDGVGVQRAWSGAWYADAWCAIEQNACGKKTVERVSVNAKGEQATRLGVWRCKSPRCRHCCQAILAPERRAQLKSAENGAHGDLAFVTLTINPAAWCEVNGVAMGPDAAVLAQRWVGRASADFLGRVRRSFGPTPAFKAVELHQSGWPHVHFVVAGGLVESMKAEGSRRGGERSTWEGMARWSKGQRKGKREGLLRAARSPTPNLRARLVKMALAAGFGVRLDVTPIAALEREAVLDYVAKGPHAYGRAKRIKDVEPGIGREVTKGKQRVDKLVARGLRCFTNDGLLDPSEKPEKTETISMRTIDAPISVVRAAAMELGLRESGLVERCDFSGDVPEVGEARPRCVESVELSDVFTVAFAAKFEPHRQTEDKSSRKVRVDRGTFDGAEGTGVNGNHDRLNQIDARQNPGPRSGDASSCRSGQIWSQPDLLDEVRLGASPGNRKRA